MVDSTRIDSVLASESDSLAGAGSEVQIFSDPSGSRTHVVLAHTGGYGTMYVGFATGVSSSVYAYAMEPGCDPLWLPFGGGANIFVRPDAEGNDYTAYELRGK